MFHAVALETEKANVMRLTIQYQSVSAPPGLDDEKLAQKMPTPEIQLNVVNENMTGRNPA